MSTRIKWTLHFNLIKKKVLSLLNLAIEGHKMDHANILKPPPSVRGMMKLNKSSFQKDIEVPCVYLENMDINNILPVFKKYLLKMEKFKAVQHEQGKTENDDKITVILSPIKIKTWSDLYEGDRETLAAQGISESNLVTRLITIDYDNYSAEDILKAVLPADKETLSSYTRVGHIVHVNLRDHLLPYKHIIGEILIDKVHSCKTVVNKIDWIDNTYRNFKMEILCGDSNMVTRVRENTCTYEFDFSEVYWNSRLSTEHDRIAGKCKMHDVVFDVFAGVGPFVVPAAKKHCIVFANDLNPESYKWLQHNARLNKVDG